MHVRRGDYVTYGFSLPYSYYHKILAELNFRRLHIVGVLDQNTKKEFLQYKPIYYGIDPIKDYKIMLAASTVIMSNSTFCWWASWFSDAHKIYFPKPKTGMFSDCHPHQKLDVSENRYQYVE